MNNQPRYKDLSTYGVGKYEPCVKNDDSFMPGGIIPPLTNTKNNKIVDEKPKSFYR